MNTSDARESDESPDAARREGARARDTAGTGDAAEADGADGGDGGAQASDAVEPPAAEDDEPAEDDAGMPEAIEVAEAADPAELAELIEMSEPVQLAEPVELTEPPRRGHALLLAGAFLAAAVLIIGAAVGIVGALTHGFRKPAPIISYQTSPVFGLRTGECVKASGQRFSVVSCAVPHDAEVFATFRLTGSSWPGTAKVRAAANAGCQRRLSGYLNPQLALSLASTYVFPGEVAWQAGTRTVICEVRAASGQLTGSVRGAGSAA